MSTEFSVTLGNESYSYGKEPESSFDILVHRLGDQIHVNFFFKGARHHVGKLKTSPEVARWLAHAFLCTTDGSPDVRSNELRVRDDGLIEHLTRGQIPSHE